jgi:hypothetical protein
MVERHAIVRLDDELLLEPEFLLEILDLRQEVDDLVRDAADDLDLGKVLLHPRCGLVLYIIQVHDFILDVEVQFPPQELAQVLVDEVVKRVALGVVGEVFFEHRTVGVLLCRRLGGELRLPGSQFLACLCVARRQVAQLLDDALGNPGVDIRLLALFRVRPVFEANDKLAILLGYRLFLVQEETAVVAVGRLDVVLFRICLDNSEMDP